MESQPLKQSPGSGSFRTYIIVDNRVWCLIMLGLLLLQFVVFKTLYPYPDFFSDSYSYISAAWMHLDVNIWPIGYSRFLSLFHWLTSSGPALITFQYLVYAFSALYFYCTITFFYHTGSFTRILLSLFLFVNPLFLYLANYVTSDILFISMSMIWLSQLLWILNRPAFYQIFLQAVLIFIMFTFRYNAMLYPVIAAMVILFSKQKTWIKTLGVLLAPALVLPFILWSGHAAKAMTGTAQFPPILGGWQWGNNALYMRAFIEEDSNAFPTSETAELDRIARSYFNQPDRPQDQLASYVANFFIREWKAPLKLYMTRHYHPKTEYEDIAAWGKSAVVFDQYGKFLIKRHPLAYARYYLLVNSKNYFIPPLEKLEIYNLGSDEMWPLGQQWFRYSSPKVWCISKPLQGTILALYPIAFLILNGYYAIALFLFIRRGGFRKVSRTVRYTLLTITVFLAMNAAFSIFANIVVIRYEVFPMLVFLTFGMLLTDYLEMISSKPKPSPAKSQIPAVTGRDSGIRFNG